MTLHDENFENVLKVGIFFISRQNGLKCSLYKITYHFIS